MTMRTTLSALALSAMFGGSAQAVTLFDASLGTAPSAQGWTTTLGGAVQTPTPGAYGFDTTSNNDIRAGSALTGQALNTSTGFRLDFSLRVASESHLTDDRAGYSVIVTGTDPSRALELAFWSDHVWVYTSTFGHGADIALDTTTLHGYSLVVQNDAYSLSVDGSVVPLGDSLVDYRAQGLPYVLPGLIFFGDDTTRAGASTVLGSVMLSPVPEPATFALMGAGLLGLGVLRRRAQR